MAWRCLEVGKPNRCVRRNRGRWKGRWGVLGRSSSGQHIYLHNLLRHRLGEHRSQEWQPKSTSTSLVAFNRDPRAGVSDPSYVSAHWFFSLGSSFARHICLNYKKMIYYAIGVVAVISYLILRRKVGESVPPDTDWDARTHNDLSTTLRNRFTRF